MPSATNKPFEATRGPQGRFQRRLDKKYVFSVFSVPGAFQGFQATASNFCLSPSQRLWRGLHIGQGSRTEARAKPVLGFQATGHAQKAGGCIPGQSYVLWLCWACVGHTDTKWWFQFKKRLRNTLGKED